MIIVVTGSPGSGKSTFSKILADKGIRLIDADAIGKEILPKIRAELVEKFGEEILDETEEVDIDKLGEQAFRTEESVRKLNSISHPLLKEEIIRRINVADCDAIIDAALYYELGLDALADVTIIVKSAHSKTRAKDERIIKRGVFQKPVAQADFEVINDGSLNELEMQAEKIWSKLQEIKG